MELSFDFNRIVLCPSLMFGPYDKYPPNIRYGSECIIRGGPQILGDKIRYVNCETVDTQNTVHAVGFGQNGVLCLAVQRKSAFGPPTKAEATDLNS